MHKLLIHLLAGTLLLSCDRFESKDSTGSNNESAANTDGERWPVFELRQAEAQSSVILSEKLRELEDTHFPLKLVIATFNPKTGLSEHYVVDREVARSDIGAEINIKKFPKEFYLGLFNRNGEKLDSLRLIDLPAQSVLKRRQGNEHFKSISKEKIHHRELTESRAYNLFSDKEYKQLAFKTQDQGIQQEVVKFVIDVNKGKVLHFANSVTWKLHYEFVNAVISRDEKIKQCVAGRENPRFLAAWRDYSDKNYTSTENREFYAGSLVNFAHLPYLLIEFTDGDALTVDLVKEIYAMVRKAVRYGKDIKIRPNSQELFEQLRKSKLKDMVISIDEPYKKTSVQLLSPGVAVGRLQLYDVAKKPSKAVLDARTIVLLKTPPENLPVVAGVISQTVQSPLSHINVLSRNRGTPHLVLRDKSAIEELDELLGLPVRLTVGNDGYEIEELDESEFARYWQKKSQKRRRFVPQVNGSRPDLVDLKDAGHESLDIIGAKAANLAELGKISSRFSHPSCDQISLDRLIRSPKDAFAIPFYHYLNHLEKSGAHAYLVSLHENDTFLSNAEFRKVELKKVRELIRNHPVDSALLQLLEVEIETRFGSQAVRFRSSTNVEDLAGFSGAGLYKSKSVLLGDQKKTLQRALGVVWASLWKRRAWEERQYYNISHLDSAMGVLVHKAYPDEKANGVVVSRDIYQAGPRRRNTYIAAQIGETSIVLPKDGSSPDELTVSWYETPQLKYFRRSDLVPRGSVLTKDESIHLGCLLNSIEDHFRPIYSVGANERFAMEGEFKILRTNNAAGREVLIKQARSYIFGEGEPTPVCD